MTEYIICYTSLFLFFHNFVPTGFRGSTLVYQNQVVRSGLNVNKTLVYNGLIITVVFVSTIWAGRVEPVFKTLNKSLQTPHEFLYEKPIGKEIKAWKASQMNKPPLELSQNS